MAFTLFTYNVLADAYIRGDRYPGTSRDVLDARRRELAVIRRVTELDADVVCLQEVEEHRFRALATALEPLGYRGELVLKKDRKPDGCAVLVRERVVQPVSFEGVAFEDAADGRTSGHVVLVARLLESGREMWIACTHLKWDPVGVPLQERWAIRQLDHLSRIVRHHASPSDWIVCGDLNLESGDPALEAAKELGFVEPNATDRPTCVANGRARKIDHVFCGASFDARPLELPLLDETSILPSEREPSDHVPLGVRLAWRGEPVEGTGS